LSHLLQEETKIIETVLIEDALVFHDVETNDFKGTDLLEDEILVGDARPRRKPQYRIPHSLMDEMKTQTQQMLDKGVIRESKFPCFALAILVPKKSTDGKLKFRLCRLSNPKCGDEIRHQSTAGLRRNFPPITAPNTLAFWTAAVDFGRVT
jgi:hypothetical protein